MSLLLLIQFSTALSSLAVDNPAKCQLSLETKLASPREMYGETKGAWLEQYVFDGRKGDTVLLREFMDQHGYFAGSSGDPTDTTMMFMADTLGKQHGWYNSVRITGDPGAGLELSCKGSWISGVPLISVLRRSEGDILYQVELN